MRPLLAIVLAVSGAVGAGFGRAGLDRLGAGQRPAQELLYLPNGKYLRAMSLGHPGLMADLVYLWAIQYYSDYERGDRYRYVEHVFGSVIGELDPHYVDPYWLGAMILVVENHDLEAGLRLLDKGFERNPQSWILPYLAGFECYRVRDYARAAAYMDKAAGVEGAPPLVLRMRAALMARAGDLREALEMWRVVLADPESDSGARAIAERQIRDLKVRIDIADLQAGVERFSAARGHHPSRLEDLVGAGLAVSIPVDPDGRPYRYERLSGRVSSPAGRILGPAPR